MTKINKYMIGFLIFIIICITCALLNPNSNQSKKVKVHKIDNITKLTIDNFNISVNKYHEVMIIGEIFKKITNPQNMYLILNDITKNSYLSDTNEIQENTCKGYLDINYKDSKYMEKLCYSYADLILSIKNKPNNYRYSNEYINSMNEISNITKLFKNDIDLYNKINNFQQKYFNNHKSEVFKNIDLNNISKVTKNDKYTNKENKKKI